MIINNLLRIMQVKKIKATRIYAETGISRSTISSLSSNSTKMIQMDTINTLCNYLSITPNEFFSYTPYNFEATSETTRGKFVSNKIGYYEDISIDSKIEGDLYIKVLNGLNKKDLFELSYVTTIETTDNPLDVSQHIKIKLLDDNDFNRLSSFFSQEHLLNFYGEINKIIDHSLRSEVSKKLLTDLNREKISDISTVEPLTLSIDMSGLLMLF